MSAIARRYPRRSSSLIPADAESLSRSLFNLLAKPLVAGPLRLAPMPEDVHVNGWQVERQCTHSERALEPSCGKEVSRQHGEQIRTCDDFTGCDKLIDGKHDSAIQLQTCQSFVHKAHRAT